MNLRSIILALLVLSILPGTPALSQKSREISKKQRELQKLRSDIEAYEKKLRESEKKERSTLERLDDLEQQGTLIRELLRNLRDEEQQISSDIRSARGSIAKLEEQLDFLKSHYAGYVRSVYKNGRVYDLDLLFSSRSINQMYIRIEYLRRFSNQRADDLKHILQKKAEVERQNDQLQENLENERKLISEKAREERSLRQKTVERQRVLSQVRKDKKTYRKELTRKTEAIHQVEKLIADLIEKERLRKEELRKQRAAAAAKQRERQRLANAVPSPPLEELEPIGTFEQRKGKLRWPVSSGVIASRFGPQTHPILRTVTQNSGIDISVGVGSNVIAVAEGEVSVISFIPGYGNVLIVNHYNGYRTVYAHLSDIHVVESQKIQEADVIGKSGDSIAGSILHFEIWKEKEKMDPEQWLFKTRAASR